MAELTIITNNKPREMLALFQLPAKALKDFDYVKEEDSFSPRFVKYKGEWYDTHDTMRVDSLPAYSPFKDWHSYISDSFFSGVLFKWGSEDDTVICGRYYS